MSQKLIMTISATKHGETEEQHFPVELGKEYKLRNPSEINVLKITIKEVK